MLVLRREVNQPIVIGGNIEVTILDIEEGDRVKISIAGLSAAPIMHSREVDQPIVIGGTIEVTILDIEEGDRVKIGVDAPSAVSIIRKELLARPRNAPRKNPS